MERSGNGLTDRMWQAIGVFPSIPGERTRDPHDVQEPRADRPSAAGTRDDPGDRKNRGCASPVPPGSNESEHVRKGRVFGGFQIIVHLW